MLHRFVTQDCNLNVSSIYVNYIRDKSEYTLYLRPKNLREYNE